MSDRYVSLGEFERMHGVHKGTVSKRAREMGFDTASGLSPEAYEAMKNEFKVSDRPSGDRSNDTPTAPTYTMRASSLVPLGERRPAIAQRVFDADGYQQDKAALQVEAQSQAAALNDAIAAYARAKVASVLAEVDLVGDSLRANALGAMGVQVGKPTDGNAA
jgi:hypothetical protein